MCPPGTDQTGRCPQHWAILLPQLEQQHLMSNPPGHRASVLDVIRDSQSTASAFWSKIAWPVNDSKPALRRARVAKGICEESAFEKLPFEILSMILLADDMKKEDLVALGLTCNSMWDLVLDHARTQCLQNPAPWAKSKIGLIGSFLQDLPAEFMLEKDIQEICSKPQYGFNCPARRWFWDACNQFEAGIPEPEQDGWFDSFETWRERVGVPVSLRPELERALSIDTFFPPDKTWVLRNFNTHEMAISSTVSTINSEAGKGPAVFNPEILRRISWTSSFACFEHGEDRGPWAGHCLDIVTLEKHREEVGPLSEQNWVDISLEFARDPKGIPEAKSPRKRRGRFAQHSAAIAGFVRQSLRR